MFTNFRTVPGQGGSPKTENDASATDLRVRQMEELCRISEDAKKEVYGPNHDETCANFYNLFEATKKMPSYRPRILAPQLQVLLLKEAAEATDSNIRIFIHKNDERDKDREKAFQEHWKKNFFGLQLLMSQVFAQFSGTAFLQAGNDSLARQGKGNVWARARKQGKIYVDPCSPWSEDWTWCIIEDDVYLDKVKKETPDHTENIRKETARSVNLAGSPAGTLELPPGPMSLTARGLPTHGETTTAGLMRRRTGYFMDAAMREVSTAEAAQFEQRKLPVPKWVPVYPQGRMIVEVEGTVLADGQSWCPIPDIWPIVPVWALPPWDNVWCPAPMKYTKSLQDAAEQQMTNTYENARRLNNGMMIIHESTGLTANTVGGMPGEIQVVAANSPPGQGVQILYPPPFPPQMITLPQSYLALQKELRGATDARSGSLQPGNVGPDLFEAAVAQSSAGTRLTARFFSYSVQKFAELLFYTMGTSYTDERVFRDGNKVAKWTPIQGEDDYEVQIPEGALRPLSESSLRSLVIELKKAQMIDTKHALELLDVPEADEIAEAVENEMKLAALAKGVKR